MDKYRVLKDLKYKGKKQIIVVLEDKIKRLQKLIKP